MDKLLALPCYDLLQNEKNQLMQDQIAWLSRWHYQRCQPYKNIIDAQGGPSLFERIETIPPLAVQLFKRFELMSIDPQDVFKTLFSSGTTSQQPSKIYLDHDTASLQSKALVKIMQQFIGKSRLPMLVIDSPGAGAESDGYSARAAGIQGLSIFGRDHTYVLRTDMTLDVEKLLDFCQRHSDQPVLVFGFTFMVWQCLLQTLNARGLKLNLPKGILIHSGGWKKLQDQAVGNEVFKTEVFKTLAIDTVHNFYGMVEQTGSIFVECDQGVLHAPIFAEILFRSFKHGNLDLHEEQGIIQVLSMLPLSYPGHNLLTEDYGRLRGVDDCPCGRKGKYFQVDGRIAKSELRGCSDTYTGAQ